MGDQTELEIGQLSKKGAEYHNSNETGKAVEYYRKAYTLAKEITNDETKRKCAFNLSAAYIALGMPSEALTYLREVTPPTDQKDEQGDLNFNMGLCHEMLKDESKAVEYFEKANGMYADCGRPKRELQIQCLEKRFQIHKKRKEFLKAADICQLMADAFNGEDALNKAKKLCEKATQLLFASKKEEAEEVAKECKKLLSPIWDTQEALNAETSNRIQLNWDDYNDAAMILNDLGLIFTQLVKYDEATDCFHEAWKLICHRHRELEHWLVAVVRQNLGASYNLTEKYQKAIECHEEAAAKYGQINDRSGQGQCFANLAFAKCQLGDLKNAEIAYHHALLAAADARDDRMKWQALEGLGDVNFYLGNKKQSVDYFIDALKAVGENKTANDRLKGKMENALLATGSMQTAKLSRGQNHMTNFGNYTLK